MLNNTKDYRLTDGSDAVFLYPIHATSPTATYTLLLMIK